MSREIDIETLTRPGGIVPVNVETTAALVRTVTRLWDMVQELADDLECEIEGHYQGTKDHPAMERRYKRDMDVVIRARGMLKAAEIG